jgi:hypothetical protein
MDWEGALEKAVSNTVAIYFYKPLGFDTDAAVASQATGFVVDSEKGSSILTSCFACDPVNLD